MAHYLTEKKLILIKNEKESHKSKTKQISEAQKVSKKTAHDINVDEKEIIQTNMISSDTDEIPQQTRYEPRAQNRVFTEKYSKAKQGVISSRLTNSNSHPTQGISSLENQKKILISAPS